MDPALWELYEGDPDDEVTGILRLNDKNIIPENVRIVSHFGEVATCRLRRGDILKVRSDSAVASFKAPRGIENTQYNENEPSEFLGKEIYHIQRPDIPETGRGVVVGIIDWGCDFAHPDFLDSSGNTRISALWEQKGISDITESNPFGRGRIYTKQDINDALIQDDPYEALDYHPGIVAPEGGAHGTHVMGIAAGNGLGSGEIGIAPEAEIIFVHADASGLGGLANFGDSASLLEAVDFIYQQADGRPCVINMSMGRHGGPHDGTTLVEKGLDTLLESSNGFVIVNSTGNYYNANIHSRGVIKENETRSLTWIVDQADKTGNELEVWYQGDDRFNIELVSPDDDVFGPVKIEDKENVIIDGEIVGRIYHRSSDPNNHKNHIDIFLYPNGPTGDWSVKLYGESIQKGNFDAWIERDAGRKENQSRFLPSDVDVECTTGTIANGSHTITVGAYDANSPTKEIAIFSSSGLTTDQRQKPELVAPGVRVLAPSSEPLESDEVELLTVKSGTSMAAPHVTGTVALMFEAANKALSIEQVRNNLFSTTDDVVKNHQDRYRLGFGYLNVESAVEKCRDQSTSTVKEELYNFVKNENLLIIENLEGWDMNMKTELIESQDDIYEINEVDELPEEFVETYRLPDFVENNPAYVFDTITGLTDYSMQEELLQQYQVVGLPGEVVTSQPRESDIVIRRVLGEGTLADVRMVANEAMALINASNDRLPNDTLLIRNGYGELSSIGSEELDLINEYDEDSAENPAAIIAVAGALISGAQLGIAVFDRLESHLLSGSFSVSSNASSYIHNPSPRGLRSHTKRFFFSISAHHPRYGIGNQNFYFQLTLEYDGFNIQRVSIIEDRGRSSSLVSSNFSITFTPSAFSAPNDPVAAIVYNINGRWDPVGRGDESFDGSLIINAQGNMPRLRVNSPQNWVRKMTPVRSRGGGTVPRPTTARHTADVSFDRPGETRVSNSSIRHIHRYYTGLPSTVRTEIRAGRIPIVLTGRASTTASVRRNQGIARERARNVAVTLRDLAGSSANLVIRSHGELGARTSDNREDPNERRVDMDVTYTLYR